MSLSPLDRAGLSRRERERGNGSLGRRTRDEGTGVLQAGVCVCVHTSTVCISVAVWVGKSVFFSRVRVVECVSGCFYNREKRCDMAE